MEHLLRPLALANGGFFLRSRALDVGLCDRDLVDGLRDRVITRLRRGAFALCETYDALDDVGRYRVLVRAVLAAQRGQVALTGPSAAAFHHLPLLTGDLNQVHLLRLDSGACRIEAGVHHHVTDRALTGDLVELDGLLATSLPRTVWETSRIAGVDAGVVAADAALHRTPELSDSLRELHRRLVNQPGARDAGAVIWLADGRSGSPGESVLRVRFVRYDVPKPDLQVEVFDEHGVLTGRADFGWEAYHHLAEFDGAIKYGRLVRPGETPSDTVVREKRREDAMRRCSKGMSRFTWSCTTHRRVEQRMAHLKYDLEQSRRLYGG